jgi:hypothetical protein
MFLISMFSARTFEHISGLEQTKWTTRGAKNRFVHPRIFLKVMSEMLRRAYLALLATTTTTTPFVSSLRVDVYAQIETG